MQYDKVEGTKNCADMMTKLLAQEAIAMAVDRMHSEFPEGQEDEALTISVLGAGRIGKEACDFIKQQTGLTGRYEGWTRTDKGSRCTRKSAKGGPDNNNVCARVTIDAKTRKIIKVDGAHGYRTEAQPHRLKTPTDITTILMYKQVKVSSDEGRSHGGKTEGKISARKLAEKSRRSHREERSPAKSLEARKPAVEGHEAVREVRGQHAHRGT